jgi:threonine/homoserine/homoserine lactone efflux protein
VNISEYILYCLAVVIMIATPGPVMLLVASAGLKGGYKKALQTIFGTNLASLVLITISVLVLKGFLNISDAWFDVVKIIGCLYIFYLGIQIVREALTNDPNNNELNLVESSQGGFQQGFLVGISNPKDIIFFASFFPQFVNITPQIDLSLVVLTLSWIVLDFATLSLVYLGFNRLSKSKVYQHILALCGVILIVVAGYGIYSVLV